MRKMNGMMTRLLACVLLLATAAVSLASCEVKEKAEEAWGTIKDGATDIYDEVKEKVGGSVVIEPLSGNEYISLCATAMTSEIAADPSAYSDTLSVSSFAGASGGMNEAGAAYVTLDRIVGKIVHVENGSEGDYMTSPAGEQPIVDIDEATSKLCVVLPNGCNTLEEWLAMAGAANFVVQISGVMQRGLQATVEPTNAPDTSVIWSVSSAEAEVDVAEYIRLVVDPSDGKKVTVVALAPFGGYEFTITCTTVLEGCTATCKVTYEGVPSYVGLLQTDGLVTDVVTLYANSTNTFEIVLGNVFGDVGSAFNRYAVGGVSWEGEYVLRKGSYTGGQWGYGVEDETVDASASKDFLNRRCLNSVYVEDGNVILKIKDSIRSYDSISDGQRSLYVSGDPILCVTVKETLSGVEQTFRFKIVQTVTSVALSDETLTF